MLITKKQTNNLSLDDFISDGNDPESIQQDEYFELKSNFENMKKINNKMYNYALEKILGSN